MLLSHSWALAWVFDICFVFSGPFSVPGHGKETFSRTRGLLLTCMCTKKGGNIIYTEHLIRAGLDFQGRVQILSVLGLPLDLLSTIPQSLAGRALLVSGASRGVGVGGW